MQIDSEINTFSERCVNILRRDFIGISWIPRTVYCTAYENISEDWKERTTLFENSEVGVRFIC